MTWNKESIKQIPKPRPFPYFKCFLVIVFSTLFLVYSLNLNNNEVVLQKELLNIVLSILPLFMSVIIFLYKYIMKRNLQIKNGKIGAHVVLVLSIVLFFFHKRQLFHI